MTAIEDRPQPTLVGSAPTGGRTLPLPEDVWVDLRGDVEHLSSHWANELFGGAPDLDSASKEDAERWLLGHITVVEAMLMLVRARQKQLAQVARSLRVHDDRVGAACGITGEAARRRKNRSTK